MSMPAGLLLQAATVGGTQGHTPHAAFWVSAVFDVRLFVSRNEPDRRRRHKGVPAAKSAADRHGGKETQDRNRHGTINAIYSTDDREAQACPMHAAAPCIPLSLQRSPITGICHNTFLQVLSLTSS